MSILYNKIWTKYQISIGFGYNFSRFISSHKQYNMHIILIDIVIVKFSRFFRIVKTPTRMVRNKEGAPEISANDEHDCRSLVRIGVQRKCARDLNSFLYFVYEITTYVICIQPYRDLSWAQIQTRFLTKKHT